MLPQPPGDVAMYKCLRHTGVTAHFELPVAANGDQPLVHTYGPGELVTVRQTAPLPCGCFHSGEDSAFALGVCFQSGEDSAFALVGVFPLPKTLPSLAFPLRRRHCFCLRVHCGEDSAVALRVCVPTASAALRRRLCVAALPPPRSSRSGRQQGPASSAAKHSTAGSRWLGGVYIPPGSQSQVIPAHTKQLPSPSNMSCGHPITRNTIFHTKFNTPD